MDNDSVSAALHRIETDMRAIVAGDGDPYEAGWRIWGEAFSLAPQSNDLMWPLWLLWGALTDWVEVNPEETDKAHAAMRRAAREWLSLNDDESSRQKYFHRWLFDELGYEKREA
jgi:hypothetical protein